MNQEKKYNWRTTIISASLTLGFMFGTIALVKDNLVLAFPLLAIGVIGVGFIENLSYRQGLKEAVKDGISTIKV